MNGNKFTVNSLTKLIKDLDGQIGKLKEDALKEYPNASYQALDQSVVELSRLQITLKLAQEVKRLELGIADAQEHISYLTDRISTLEHFYFVANDTDAVALENAIMEIKHIVVKLKRNIYNKCNQEFEIDLDQHELNTVRGIRYE